MDRRKAAYVHVIEPVNLGNPQRLRSLVRQGRSSAGRLNVASEMSSPMPAVRDLSKAGKGAKHGNAAVVQPGRAGRTGHV